MFFQDTEGNLVAVSETFVELLHRDGDFAFPPDVTTYLSPAELPRARKDFARLLSGGFLLNECYILRLGVFSVTAFPVYRKGRKPFGIVGCVLPLAEACKDPAITLEEALATLWALEKRLRDLDTRKPRKTTPAYLLLRLSPREVEVFRCLAEGHSVQEIARLLGISPNTVETHRRSILRKLNLPSMAHLVRAAVFLGLVPEDPWG